LLVQEQDLLNLFHARNLVVQDWSIAIPNDLAHLDRRRLANTNPVLDFFLNHYMTWDAHFFHFWGQYKIRDLHWIYGTPAYQEAKTNNRLMLEFYRGICMEEANVKDLMPFIEEYNRKIHGHA
jgi:hypothetical protein